MKLKLKHMDSSLKIFDTKWRVKDEEKNKWKKYDEKVKKFFLKLFIIQFTFKKKTIPFPKI